MEKGTRNRRAILPAALLATAAALALGGCAKHDHKAASDTAASAREFTTGSGTYEVVPAKQKGVHVNLPDTGPAPGISGGTAPSAPSPKPNSTPTG